MRLTLPFLILATYAVAPGLYAQSKKGPPATPAALQAPVDVASYFVASGYMGDGELGTQYVKVTPVAGPMCRGGNAPCIKVSYQRGSQAWGGVYWQSPANNWGNSPGRQIEGATKITFWAAGDKGGEIVEFKAGGIQDRPKTATSSMEPVKILLTLAGSPPSQVVPTLKASRLLATALTFL